METTASSGGIWEFSVSFTLGVVKIAILKRLRYLSQGHGDSLQNHVTVKN
jgi:hypothetical protein